MPRLPKTTEQTRAELLALRAEIVDALDMLDAAHAADDAELTKTACLQLAGSFGQGQRRARLLAGLGRGG